MLAATLFMAVELLSAQPAWKTFSGEGFIPQVINTHFEDKYGNLWLGTASGISVFYNGQWVTVSHIQDSVHKTQESLGNVVQFYQDRSGKIWVISEGKLFIYDGNTWGYYKNEDFSGYTVRHFLSDSRNHIWLCSEYEKLDQYENILSKPEIYGTITRFNGLQWISYGQEAGGSNYVQPGDPKQFYTGIIEDKRGYVWIGSVTGVFIFAGNQWITIRDETLPGTYVTGIATDRVGNVWVGTTGGLAMFNGSSWHIYKRADGLGGNHVRQIVTDTQGLVWAFIYGNMNFLGLSCFDGLNWTFYKTGKDIPSGNITSNAEDFRQSGMILTRSGFGRYDGKSWNLPGPAQGLDGTRFYFLEADSSGTAWISTDKGLFREEGPDFSKIISPPGGTWEIVAMFCDSRGRIWVATSTGEVYLHEEGNTRHFKASDGLLNESVREIVEDKSGRIWLMYRKETALFEF